jgi:hypothetical protein
MSQNRFNSLEAFLSEPTLNASAMIIASVDQVSIFPRQHCAEQRLLVGLGEWVFQREAQIKAPTLVYCDNSSSQSGVFLICPFFVRDCQMLNVMAV